MRKAFSKDVASVGASTTFSPPSPGYEGRGKQQEAYNKRKRPAISVIQTLPIEHMQLSERWGERMVGGSCDVRHVTAVSEDDQTA